MFNKKVLKTVPCYLVTILISILSFNATSFSAKSIDIIWVTESWPEYTNKDGTGLYHELLSRIFAQSPYNITVKYLPWRRALNQVAKNEAQISGALPLNDLYLFASVPILTQPISILVNVNSQQFSLQQLAGLIGTWPEMYEHELMQPQIAPYINAITSKDRADALKLLINSKVDYYLDIKPMLEAQLATLPAEQQQNYQIQNLSTLNLYLIFSNDEKGRAVREYYDSQTKLLLSKNILQSIYQKYHITPPLETLK